MLSDETHSLICGEIGITQWKKVKIKMYWILSGGNLRRFTRVDNKKKCLNVYNWTGMIVTLHQMTKGGWHPRAFSIFVPGPINQYGTHKKGGMVILPNNNHLPLKTARYGTVGGVESLGCFGRHVHSPPADALMQWNF